MALQKLLTPLYNLGQKRSQAIPKDLSNSLFTIVNIAGILSREMRRCGDVIYHWPLTFKDGMCSLKASSELIKIVSLNISGICTNKSSRGV